jgi:hypothetical protein
MTHMLFYEKILRKFPTQPTVHPYLFFLAAFFLASLRAFVKLS